MALRKGSVILSILLLFSSSHAQAQNCNLVKYGATSPSLADTLIQKELTDRMLADTSDKYYIILLRNPGELPQSSISYLEGTNERYSFKYIENGIVLNKMDVVDKSISPSLKSISNLRGYFIGECDNNKWGHVSERLLVINNKEKVSLEILSYNEDLRDILKSNSMTTDLVYLYDLAIKLSKSK